MDDDGDGDKAPDNHLAKPVDKAAVTEVARRWNEAMIKFHDPTADDLDELIPIAQYDDAFVEFVETCGRPCKFFVIDDIAYLIDHSTEFFPVDGEIPTYVLGSYTPKALNKKVIDADSWSAKVANVVALKTMPEGYHSDKVVITSVIFIRKKPTHT